MTATAAKYLDLLPKRNGKSIALTWVPESSDYGHGEGYATLTSDRDATTYGVCQSPGDGPLLSFTMRKVGGKGSDKDRQWYVLSATRSGSEVHCDCRGYARHQHCKHSDCLQTLIQNRWLEG